MLKETPPLWRKYTKVHKGTQFYALLRRFFSLFVPFIGVLSS